MCPLVVLACIEPVVAWLLCFYSCFFIHMGMYYSSQDYCAVPYREDYFIEEDEVFPFPTPVNLHKAILQTGSEEVPLLSLHIVAWKYSC